MYILKIDFYSNKKTSDIKTQFRTGLQSLSKHLAPALRNQQGVLELSTALAIPSHSGPVIVPKDILIGALVDHRLNSEHMTFLHKACGFIALVMRNIRGTVEEFAHAMPSVGTHHTEALFLDVFPDHIADFSVHDPGFTDGNGQFQGTVSLFN